MSARMYARTYARTYAKTMATALLPLVGAACASSTGGATTPTPVVAPARAAFVAAVDSMLADPRWRPARWGVLVVHPRTGDTLYARDADKLFMPASNQKLVTGAAALAILGPDFRWRTAIAVPRGAFRDGVVRGDLHVVGRGDPTVSDRMRGDAMTPLRAMADTLRARGVRRVEGEVVAGGTAFPGDYWGFGWGWDDFDEPYSAGVSELLFNEGLARVVVRGGDRPGDAPRVVVRPAARIVPLDVAVTTATPGVVGMGTTATRVTARWSPETLRYRVEGVVSAGDSAVLTLAIREPRLAYAAAFAEALRERGIAVDTSRVAVTRGRLCLGLGCDAPTPLDTIAVMWSPPLREVLPALEKPSQNQIAEALFRSIGYERTLVGTPDSARRVVYEQLRQWGIAPEHEAVVRDGSGLSRHDYLTPRTLVRILDAMRQRPDSMVFIDALPVAGVDGTLANRMKGTPAERNVRAKTGTVDKARSLSGYVTSADGELLLFSFLCNNHTVPTRDVDAVQDAIAARLAAMRVRALGAAPVRRTASAP
ncbi:MAG TPA: D-alanyl-D-alanine carboxypeptidase/D-alanyl-D-alanine-endopeptidase [Gemmatirosa sp.]|nr:D-alanyl-D-alanine carboxypeptidase/D-alanyl-D-alanine-endopeptidase [Gemmatirosa sp.]